MPFHACISLHHLPKLQPANFFLGMRRSSPSFYLQKLDFKNYPFARGLHDPFAKAGTLLQVLGLPFCKGWGCPFARARKHLARGYPFARVKGNACATNPFARAVQASIPFARVILLQGSHAGRSFAGCLVGKLLQLLGLLLGLLAHIGTFHQCLFQGRWTWLLQEQVFQLVLDLFQGLKLLLNFIFGHL